MSRANYSEDLENWDLIRWRGQVASAIRGKRGQKFLTELLEALDAMPEKRLIRDDLQNEDGEVCAIGALGLKRGINLQKLDPEDPDQVAAAFDIAEQLSREVVYMNDEYCDRETPEERWKGMRAWVAKQITSTPADATLDTVS